MEEMREKISFFSDIKKNTKIMKDTAKLFSDVMTAIQAHDDVWTFEEIQNYVCVTTRTLYNHFPVGSERRNEINEAIETNRMKSRKSVRKEMLEKKDPSCLIALYKILATPDERKALASHFIETSTDKLKPLEIHVIDPKKEGNKEKKQKK